MKRAGWLASTDPYRMLLFLKDRPSDRKLKLLVLAWLRLDFDESWRTVVETAERWADGTATGRDLWNDYRVVMSRLMMDQPPVIAAIIQRLLGIDTAWSHRERRVGGTPVSPTFIDIVDAWDLLRVPLGSGSQTAAEVLRDIFGNPFRQPSLTVEPTQSVVALARAAYEQRALPSGNMERDRLAVLADALEESRCADQEILNHLRQPETVHVRGCWAIDFLLKRA